MRKLALAPLLICLHCLLSIGQSPVGDPMTTEGRKTSFGFVFSMDYCNRLFRNVGGAEMDDIFIEVRNKGEIAKPGYTTGFSIHFPVGQSGDLRSGLLYSNKGYQRPWERNLHWPVQPEPNITGIKSIYTYHYLDIPMVYEVFLDRSHAKWFFGIGATANILLQSKYIQLIEDHGDTRRSARKETYDHNPLQLSPEISFGRHFLIGNLIHVRVAPTFRCSIIKTYDSPIAEHLWTAGLSLTCSL
jgi:hypothetical protein